MTDPSVRQPVPSPLRAWRRWHVPAPCWSAAKVRAGADAPSSPPATPRSRATRPSLRSSSAPSTTSTLDSTSLRRRRAATGYHPPDDPEQAVSAMSTPAAHTARTILARREPREYPHSDDPRVVALLTAPPRRPGRRWMPRRRGAGRTVQSGPTTTLGPSEPLTPPGRHPSTSGPVVEAVGPGWFDGSRRAPRRGPPTAPRASSGRPVRAGAGTGCALVPRVRRPRVVCHADPAAPRQGLIDKAPPSGCVSPPAPPAGAASPTGILHSGDCLAATERGTALSARGGRLHHPGRPVVQPGERCLDEPGAVVRPRPGQQRLTDYRVCVVGPIAGAAIAVGIAPPPASMVSPSVRCAPHPPKPGMR